MPARKWNLPTFDDKSTGRLSLIFSDICLFVHSTQLSRLLIKRRGVTWGARGSLDSIDKSMSCERCGGYFANPGRPSTRRQKLVRNAVRTAGVAEVGDLVNRKRYQVLMG